MSSPKELPSLIGPTRRSHPIAIGLQRLGVPNDEEGAARAGEADVDPPLVGDKPDAARPPALLARPRSRIREDVSRGVVDSRHAVVTGQGEYMGARSRLQLCS